MDADAPNSVPSRAAEPNRREVIAGLAATTLGAGAAAAAMSQDPQPQGKPAAGKSPWGEDTWKEPTPAPVSVRPGEQTLPSAPRKYTDIKSYHAHVYFDEDSHA